MEVIRPGDDGGDMAAEVHQNGTEPRTGHNDKVPDPLREIPFSHDLATVPTQMSCVPRMMRTNPDDEPTPHLVLVFDTPNSRDCFAYPLEAMPKVIQHIIESMRATPLALGIPNDTGPRLIIPGQ